MQCFLLLGDENRQEEYIDKFIKKHKILPYNVYRYSDRIKIIDARSIKQKLSLKATSSILFVLTSNITNEAQNALLKILEELPEQVYVFLLAKTRDDFLPTIASRSFAVPLGIEAQTHSAYEQILKEYASSNTLFSALYTVEKLNVASPEDIENLIFSARSLLRNEVQQDYNVRKIFLFIELISQLEKIKQLLFINNVNKRFALEIIFLSVLKQFEAI